MSANIACPRNDFLAIDGFDASFPLAAAEGFMPDYEPSVTTSFLARARQRGCTALEALYDHFAEGDGSNLVPTWAWPTAGASRRACVPT